MNCWPRSLVYSGTTIPLSETKRSGGSDVATEKWVLNVVFACDDLCTLCYAVSHLLIQSVYTQLPSIIVLYVTVPVQLVGTVNGQRYMYLNRLLFLTLQEAEKCNILLLLTYWTAKRCNNPLLLTYWTAEKCNALLLLMLLEAEKFNVPLLLMI